MTGGGDLSSNRSFEVAYGSTSVTACVGDDARLSDTRRPTSGYAEVDTSQTTTSTTATDLTTVGPTVNLVTAASQRVLVFCQAELFATGVVGRVRMGFAASGATTQSATAVVVHNGNGNEEQYCGFADLVCNAGTTTFTAKYWVSAGTGRFQLRKLWVVAIP